jgi:cation transport protein ChaC
MPGLVPGIHVFRPCKRDGGETWMAGTSPAMTEQGDRVAMSSPEFWIFGYGSLIWRPEFEFLERRPARLIGAHRALCVYSHVHRGTPEQPGLVLGLDRGGSCRGIAYRVAPARREATLDYLRAREQVTMVYREVERLVDLLDENERRVHAVTYLVDRSHSQYAGDLPLERQLHLVRQGHGRSGVNRDYVLSTAQELAALGIRDHALEWLAARL